MTTLTCRQHGGTFTIAPKRGRRPVRCGGDNPLCSRATGQQTVSSSTKPPRPTSPPLPPPVASGRGTEPRASANPSLAPAMAAKALLEAQGWIVKGKASGESAAEITAARGDETLVISWFDGDFIAQDYSLWSEVPRENNKPKDSLTFDPDECTDRELVRALSGMRVTWWNKLGQLEETAIIGPNKITIEHAYSGTGDESPGDRIVKFTDHSGAGFRAFRVAALLKVG